MTKKGNRMHHGGQKRGSASSGKAPSTGKLGSKQNARNTLSLEYRFHFARLAQL
jgi:hypothetical protein